MVNSFGKDYAVADQVENVCEINEGESYRDFVFHWVALDKSRKLTRQGRREGIFIRPNY